MAGGGASSKATRLRKRVEADTTSSASLKRARDGSAFAKCEECNKDVPVALISFHNCSLDAKIKMNLESQIVEMPPSEPKKKPAPEKKSKKAEPKAQKKRSAKDPNKPKRPATAFFVFMEDFRKSYKEANPDAKGGAMVAKEGGEAWKLMSDEEKKVYTDKAAELKAEYEKAMEEYNEAEDDEQEAENEAEEKVDGEEAKEDVDGEEAKEDVDVEEAKEDVDGDDSLEKEAKEDVGGDDLEKEAEVNELEDDI